MDDLTQLRLVLFSGVLAMQYHPKNDIQPKDDPQVIARCLRVSDLAATAFNIYYEKDEIPF